MTETTVKSICDFTFGMLFMFQIIGTVAMYTKGRRHHLQKMMFWFMLYLDSISIIEAVYFFFFPSTPHSLTSHLTDILEMTVIPCALIIIIRLTRPREKLLFPIVANIMLYASCMALFVIFKSETIYKSILAFSLLYSIFIIAYGWVLVRRFNKELKENFADDMLSLYWLNYIVCLYIAMLMIWLAATIYACEWMIAIYNVCMLVFFSLWCYFVYKQEDMLEVLESDKNTGPDTKGDSTPSKGPDYHFADNFDKMFSERHLYLNPTLNINGLARELGTNRTYISNFINQQLHTTFYEYVNHWRVKRAKELLEETSQPIEQVAANSGFNSLSSFRRYFAKVVGMTPAKYRKTKALPTVSAD